jgi:hypothetical protein
MRGELQPNGVRKPLEQRVYLATGEYDPLNPQIIESYQPATNYTITDLLAFTLYEFQVLAQNDAGRAASEWTAARTKETCKYMYVCLFRGYDGLIVAEGRQLGYIDTI